MFKWVKRIFLFVYLLISLFVINIRYDPTNTRVVKLLALFRRCSYPCLSFNCFSPLWSFLKLLFVAYASLKIKKIRLCDWFESVGAVMSSQVRWWLCTGEFGRPGTGGDQQEPVESDQSRLRRRPESDIHADAARLIPAISRLQDVCCAAAAVTYGDWLFDLRGRHQTW